MKNYNGNIDSIKNQDIKSDFVRREVGTCLTTMVNYILEKSAEDNNAPFSYDDIENLYHPLCPNCGNEAEKTENDEGETIYKCSCCDWESEEEPETEPNEIFEWWSVSDWLCDKLAEKGECVLRDENLWGRGTSGQAIKLDYVISEICADIEILEGQKNER